MSDVVTGEAVVVEVRTAQLPTRAVALIIDWVAQVALLYGANTLLASATRVADPALSAALHILLSALLVVGYPVAFETLTRGRSPGKLAMGLRVVGDDGGPERFRQAMFRGMAALPEIWMFFGAPALISSLVSPRGKRLGDVFAGTIVISERGPRAQPPPPMPPELAGWAATLELSRLPDEVANTARSYLTRWHQLSPAVRQELGARIATQVAAFVSPPPPPGASHFAFLAAVLAERRRRAEARLGGQARHRVRPAVPGAVAADAVPGPAPEAAPAPAPSPPAPPSAPPPGPPSAPPSGEARVTPGGFVPPA